MRSNNSVVVKRASFMTKLYLLPPIFKMLLALGLFIFISLAGSVILYRESTEVMNNLSQKKTDLEIEVTKQARSFGELGYLSKNAKKAKTQYEDLLKQFPPEFKIGDLLANITKLGTAQGVKFIYFKPQPPVNRVYYAEVPVEISVTGEFHQIGRFLSGVANLEGSVVVVNKFKLSRTDDRSNLLSLEFTATLYHSLSTSPDAKA